MEKDGKLLHVFDSAKRGLPDNWQPRGIRTFTPEEEQRIWQEGERKIPPPMTQEEIIRHMQEGERRIQPQMSQQEIIDFMQQGERVRPSPPVKKF